MQILALRIEFRDNSEVGTLIKQELHNRLVTFE
jgi:hypothetical protein